jgi:hypothetical protein
MFLLIAGGAVAAALSQTIAWDKTNKATLEGRRKDRALTKGAFGKNTRAEPVTALPEFIEVTHVAFGSLLMTGREVIWWTAEGLPTRDSSKTQRKIRWVMEQQKARLELVRSGRAGIA